MVFEFTKPLWLLLIPVACGAIWLMARLWPAHSLKGRISHALHHALILLTAFALAGASVLGAAQVKSSWLLLDASGSLGGQDLSGLVEEALAALDEDEQAGVIVFGGNAMVETPLSEEPVFSGVQTAVDASGSDLSQALLLAGALLPSDHSGGIAVISDGLVEPADTSALVARGVAVNTLQVSCAEVTDAQVTQVQLPARAYQGQSFPVTVTVHSNTEGSARILLISGQSTAVSRDVTLRRGENTFVFQDKAGASGVATYEAQVVLPGDSNSRNDRMGAYIAVSGAPYVLLAEGKSGEGGELRKMLEASGITVETMTAAMLPSDAADYLAWHAIAMVNVDADTLSREQIAALSAASRELGRGVAFFGGDSSYALGNYRGSPLEEMLPVTIDVKNKLDLPSTALLLVIDKSGSMTAGQYGVTRLEVAKEAACRALEVLTEQDMAGVIAFDEHGKWALPLTKVTDVPAMQEMIGTIRPGGGTAFYTPLAMALDAMKKADAQHKHVIFLTDGQSGDQGYEQLVELMAEQGVTLTAVAIGSGADVRTMLTLAELGGGRAYAAGEFDNVPKIFTKETLLAAGTYVQNRTFIPRITDNTMTDFPGFPQLTGYLAATEKPLATVSLISDREDPILAWWQYGAGRVLCWMSDVQGAWSSSFLQWENAAAFFGGMISHVLPDNTQAGEMHMAEGSLSFTSDEEIMEGSIQARILTPQQESLTLPLEQVAANRYEAAWEAVEPGAYAVQVIQQHEGASAVLLDGGAVVSYSREYDLRAADTGVLADISQTTGGKVTEAASQLLDFPRSHARTRHDLTPVLMLLALILLVTDIAQRRLNWEKTLVQAIPAKQVIKTGNHALVKQPVKEEASPAQTSQKLWENMQNRKRL